MKKQPGMIVLKDGTIFHGNVIGAKQDIYGEVVFNTATTGYQEILSDKSYRGQIVVFTFPHIGIVGTNDDDQEAVKAYVGGCIMQDCAEAPSNWRSKQSLNEYLCEHNITGLAGVDTRALTTHIRQHGAMPAYITTNVTDVDGAIKKAQLAPEIADADLSGMTSTTKSYRWNTSSWPDNDFLTQKNTTYNVVVVDFGVKREILRQLVNNDSAVTVVSSNSSVAAIVALKPDGILLSNGPGDPRTCDYGIKLAQELMKTNTPIYGICFGHQLMGLAQEATISQMKFGHHGANHPLLNIDTNEVSISSQNHNYVISDDNLPANISITYRSLFDNTIAGVKYKNSRNISFQGHPEASPGPTENNILFKDFFKEIAEHKAEMEI